MSPYENYCNSMKDRGLKPTMSEPQLLEAWGIKVEDDYKPFLARKSSSHKKIEPTLSNHTSKSSSKPQLKINLLDIPKPDNSALILDLESRIAEKKTKKPKKLTRSPNQVDRISFKNMTDDEIKAHRSRLNKERRLRKKEDGTLNTLCDEDIAKQREYARKYYHDNRDVQLQKQNDRRKNRTEEQKERVREEARKWQEKNREHVNAKAREWKKKKREEMKARNNEK